MADFLSPPEPPRGPRPLHALVVCAGGAAAGWFLCDLATVPRMGRAILSPSAQAALPAWGLPVWLAAGAAAAALSWLAGAATLAALRRLSFRDALRRAAWWFAPLGILWLEPLSYLSPRLFYFPAFLIPLAFGAAAGVKVASLGMDAAPADSSESGSHARFAAWGAAAGAGLFVAAFAALNVLQFRANNVPFTDSGYFERMLWNLGRGNILHADEHEHIFLGTRVRFIQFALWPAYALWPGMATLTLLQTLGVAAGAGAVYALARRVLDDRRLAAACAGAYLLHPAVQYLVSDASGEIVRLGTFGLPAALWGLCWLEQRRYGLASAAFAAGLACREEYALVAAAAGAYALWTAQHRRAGSDGDEAEAAARARARRFGWAWLVVGLAWFALALFVVIPGFRGGGFGGFKYYDALGSTAPQVARSLLTRPWRAARLMASPAKVGFVLHLLVPLLLIPLWSPGRLALAALALAVCLLSSRYQAASILFHYHAPVLPFVFFALPFGLRRVRARLRPRAASADAGLAWALVVAALVSGALVGKSPLSLNFWDPQSPYYWRRMYVPTDAAREVRRLARALPRRAKVCATEFAAAHFTHHARVWMFPKHLDDADAVVFDRGDRWARRSPDAQRIFIQRVARSPDWTLYSDRFGVAAYVRRTAGFARNPKTSQPAAAPTPPLWVETGRGVGASPG